MVFSTHADSEYIDLHYPISEDPNPTSPQISDFRRDKLKNKLRNGVPIHTTDRPELYKKLILHGGLNLTDIEEENESITPIVQSLTDVSGDELETYLASCSVFDKGLMHFPWLTKQGHIIRNLILQRVQRDLPQVSSCPLLPLVVAILLVYIESAEDVFGLVETFLIQECPIARSANLAAADDLTLRDLALLKVKSDKIRAWLSSSPQLSFWRVWIVKLPLPTLVTFLDCLLLEGPKIKFRFALAFLIMAKNNGYFDQPTSLRNSITETEAEEIITKIQDCQKILPKAFGIKRLSWSTVGKLIARHKVLLDLSTGGLMGTSYSAVSRLSQANAGEYFGQARNAQSDIVRVGDMARLIAVLPPRFTVQQLNKIMTTKSDGYSLRSVAAKIGEKSDILILIKPNRGQDILFGAFLTGIDAIKGGVSGTGESFVFRIETEVESWIWTEGAPSLFACFDHSHLLIGNGSISIDSDLKFCSTTQSDVFNNPNLLTKDNSFQTFEIVQLELFSFNDYDS